MAAPALDLTSRISPFLDRHLVFPLLEFLQEKKIYAGEERAAGPSAWSS